MTTTAPASTLAIDDEVEYQPNAFNPGVKRYVGKVTDIDHHCVWVEVETRYGKRIKTCHRQWLKKLKRTA